MIETYFTKIRYQILKCLEEATEEILVAVYWFTNTDLFNQLCLKLSEGISVELIICNDSINNRPTGLDFQHFIELGGKLFFSDSEKPMHNKFCIIDKKTLINGSYNWTYFAEIKNYENILIIQDDISTLNKFDVEFRKLKDGLFQVKEYYKSSTSSSSKVQTFDKLSFLLEDLISEAQEKDIPELLEEALNLKSNFIAILYTSFYSSISSIKSVCIPISIYNQCTACNAILLAGSSFVSGMVVLPVVIRLL